MVGMDGARGNGSPDYGASCAWCEHTRGIGANEDDDILRTIGGRFGRATAQAAHDALHDPIFVSIRDDYETPFPGEWWEGTDGDSESPAIDKTTLLSLIRLCNAMSAISVIEPSDVTAGKRKSEKEWIRWQRCATLIRTAASMDRGRASHVRAERYAAAVIVDPDPVSESNKGMDPALHLNDASLLLETIAAIKGAWPQEHEETIHDHLPVLSRMLRDGAAADEIKETVAILGAWDKSALMQFALEPCTHPDMDAIRTVLSLYRMESDPDSVTGWHGKWDDGEDWEHWRAPVAKAIAQAGMRYAGGAAIDAHGENGETAMNRAVTMLTGALEQHDGKPLAKPAAYRDMITIVSYAARSAIDDPDAMDMICMMARTAKTIEDGNDGEAFFDPVAGYTRFNPIDPILDRKGEGMRTLAEAATMVEDGLPAAFVIETMFAAMGIDTRT